MSFQEIDESLSSANNRELPGIFRRGSIAPLAARIRAKRPPTAPPGSIYRTDYDSRSVIRFYNTVLYISFSYCKLEGYLSRKNFVRL